LIAVDQLKPADQNDVRKGGVYKPLTLDDPELKDFIEQVRRDGQIFQPIHVTRDNTIISGHRRHFAAQQVGITHLKVIRVSMDSDDPRLKGLLATLNLGRDKDPGERMREALAMMDKDAAYKAVVARRMKAPTRTDRSDVCCTTEEETLENAGKREARVFCSDHQSN
jgi:ParB-like chromosome segregation protein Spo0J